MTKNTINLQYRTSAKVNTKKGKLFKYLEQLDSSVRNVRIYDAIENYYYPKAVSKLDDVSDQELKEITLECISELMGRVQSLAIWAGLDYRDILCSSLGGSVNSGGTNTQAESRPSAESSNQTSDNEDQIEEEVEEEEDSELKRLNEFYKNHPDRYIPSEGDEEKGQELINQLIQGI